MLVIFSGLPGVGKTTIARELARQLAAVYLRIDSIEQAIRDSGPKLRELEDEGYRAAYAVAEDNLRLGRTVIADCVNPLKITRDAWMGVARRARVPAIEIEILCSSIQEHRNRVERRKIDIPGLKAPTWKDVIAREYEPWDRDRITIDTAETSVEECVAMIRESIMGA
jgi:predicted kinase